jgi:hypothetical protein
MPKLPVKVDPAQASFASRSDTVPYSFSEDTFAGTVETTSTQLTALLTQFQSRYPNASLVAELLMMHENQFVVRALVQIGGAALVSGMAAATNIEQAEDRAKLRALETLALQPALAKFPEGIVPRAEIASPVLQSSYELQLRVSTPEALAPADPVAPPEPLPTALPANFSSSLPTIEPIEERPAAAIESVGVPDIPLPSWDMPQPEPEPVSTPVYPPATETIDLADAIARTSVELKRLGWTNVKGREHLEKTYGKRSRQQLTDTELLDFLRFLETQPSPGQAPV